MSRRLLSALIPVCVALVAGTLAYTASATVPTNKLYAMLNGTHEVPGPGDPDATGAAVVTVRPTTNQVCVTVRFARVDGTLSGFHIHGGPRGVAGPIVVDLTSVLSSGGVGVRDDQRRDDDGDQGQPQGASTAMCTRPQPFGAGAIRSQLFDSDI